MSPEQALEDLRRNAAAGDLVLLQEIASRYRPLVQDAFPSSDWEVYYGRKDNAEPIAFRRAFFTKVTGRATLLHPARAHAHTRRYVTYLRLRSDGVGSDLHVTNLHLVAGAFNNTPKPDKELRVREWNEGMAKHLAFVEDLVRTGLPVVGGGDYNRQLRRHKALGTEIAGRPVVYGVDAGAIDLLWFVDGDTATWGLLSRELFSGRDARVPRRNSDHAARLAAVTLATAPARAPSPASPPPHPPKAAKPAKHWPPPYELTKFGDVGPKTVDWKTRAALEEAERMLGYPLTVVQGSYNRGGVSASAGTHDSGGVVDLKEWDFNRKVRVLRALGFAAWHRPAVKGLWGGHVHAVMIDHGKLSDVARRQVDAYRLGRDGLKSNAVDNTWRPDPIPVFHYPPAQPATGDDDEDRPGPRVDEVVPPLGSAYPPRRTLDGVDTSHYQSGRIDVRKAQRAGLRWWYLKATEGTSVVDSRYRKRLRQARDAGIPVGAYHFARPDGGDAVAEARFFLEHTDIRAGDMLPMLDLESREVLSSSELTTWTGVWVTTVRRELARRGLAAKPIIYTPFDLGDAFGCLLWVARYSDDFRAPVLPKPWKRAVIWQHSNGRFGPVKNVPGFGPVDVNALHPDVPLSALRIRPKDASGTPSEGGPRMDKSATPPSSQTDLQEVRSQLQAAVKSLQAAIDRLPEG